MTADSRPLKIGDVAEGAGVGVETIRYYQRRRLLDEPDRPYGGQRVYPRTTIDRVKFIKRAQTLGFSLEDIRELLRLDSGTGHAQARALATQRLAEIDARLSDLAAMRAALRTLVRRCENTRGKMACPIVATIVAPDPPQ